MRADYINPFISSMTATFSTMLSCDVERGELRLKKNPDPCSGVSGIIGLTGKAAGTVVLNFSHPVARGASATMLMMDDAELTDGDIVDAVGEITNMVAGSAKAKLQEYELSIGLPNVVMGESHEVRYPKDISPLVVPFTTKWGKLTLEVGLVEVVAPVPA